MQAWRLGGVYKTTDGGNNWRPINDGIDTNGWEWASIVAISPEDSQRLYYSQARSLYTSTNGGESWTEILSGGDQRSVCPRQIVSLAIDPGNPNSLLAFNLENPGENIICQEGVYKSSDNGRSWVLTLQLEPVFGLNPATLVFDATGENLYAATAHNAAYRSNDRGETWQILPIADCRGFTVDSRNGLTAYCVSYDKIIVTRDGGESWRDWLEADHAQSIAVSPHSSQTVLVGWDGLWMTTDNGQSWTNPNNGLGATHIDLSFDLLEPPAMLLEDETCTVHRSTDGGRQWELAPERTCQSKTAITASGEWFYWIDKDDGSLRRSNDKGATSQQLNWPIENEWPEIIASHPTEASRLLTVYSLEYPYFFISDDLGESWRGATLIEWDKYSWPGPAPRMFFDQSLGQRIYLIELSRVYRSDDAGESWQECSNGGNTGSWHGTASRKAGLIVHPDDADHLILATRGNGVLVSTDGCQSWRQSNTGLGSLFVNSVAIDPNNPDIVYAGTDGGAYVSFDGGASWGPINDGLLGALVIYSIVVDPQSNVYAATPYGVFKLQASAVAP